jgi:hydrogenase maturation protease
MATASKTLVIGYGNTLRGDDGVGPRVADAVAGWGLPDVEAIAVHQLTPELAEPLADARVAIFVDARLAGAGESFRIRPIEAGGPAAGLGHTGDPRSLLALAQGAFGRHPRAWLITVPAADLAMGEGLSPAVERQRQAVLRHIAGMTKVVSLDSASDER